MKIFFALTSNITVWIFAYYLGKWNCHNVYVFILLFLLVAFINIVPHISFKKKSDNESPFKHFRAIPIGELKTKTKAKNPFMVEYEHNGNTKTE